MLSLGAVACSSSGSGSGSDAAADADGDASASGNSEAFCAKAKQLQASPPSDDPAAAAAAFADLSATAPNDDIRAALTTLLAAIDKLDTVMPSDTSNSSGDMAGFEELMKVIMDPKFIAAGETLSAFALKECGIDIDTDLGADSTTPDGDSAAPSGPNIFDDIEAGEFGKVVDPYLQTNAPQYRIASILMSEQSEYALIEVGLTGSGPLRAADLCRTVDAYVVANTEDPDYAISIIQDGTKQQLAGKQPGQPCTAG